jgi:hypothetical protein
MRKLALVTMTLVLLVWTQAALAEPTLVKGKTMIAVQICEGTGDFVTPDFDNNGFISAYDHSELGVQVQLWHMMGDDWALALSGGLGFFRETNEPGDRAAGGSQDFKYSQSSFQVRAGTDRVVHLNDKVDFFVGPGIQIWSGKGKWEGQGFPTTLEATRTTRIALAGRIGAHVAFSEHLGLVGELGHYFGHASANDNNARASWWPSGQQGEVGVAFQF